MLSRARLGAREIGRRSTLEMPLPKSWQAQHSVHLSVCLRGRGSIWQLSKGLGCCRARGSGLAKSWQPQRFEDAVAEAVAGAAFCASECVFAWQGQHLAAVYRGMLSRARLGAREIAAGAALWRCHCRSRGRRSILCV